MTSKPLTHEPSVETEEGFLEKFLSLASDFAVEHIVDIAQTNLVVYMITDSLDSLF